VSVRIEESVFRASPQEPSSARGGLNHNCQVGGRSMVADEFTPVERPETLSTINALRSDVAVGSGALNHNGLNLEAIMATSHTSSTSSFPQKVLVSEPNLSDDKGVNFDAPPIDYGRIRPEMTFTEAATAYDMWMSCPGSSRRARYRAPRTTKDIRTKMKALNKFFGPQTLDKIGSLHLREYQKQRFSNEGSRWAQTCGAKKINSELSVLLRILKLGNAYSSDIQKWYQTLQEDECEIPKALTPDEQEHFLAVAESNPRWHVIWWYSLLALHTGFSSDELRTIRQGDINLQYQILAVNRTIGKNRFRRREIALTDSQCLWALERLLDRAITLGDKNPSYHLFPKRISRGHYDGSQHIGETGVRQMFEEVRDAAGLQWFKLNGWRHTSITRMAEAGVAMQVIMARAGHTSPKMSQHYIHISEQAERIALQRMGPRSRVVSQQPWSPATPPKRLPTMNEADMQAEIDRRVALALEKILGKTAEQNAEPTQDSRLITFPGGSL
jgi:integrase